MVEKEELVEEGYEKIAEEYHVSRGIFDNEKELNEFAGLLPKGAKILDVGCGAGVPVTKFLIDSGFEVIGIDLSERMLKLAREHVPKAKFIKMNMTDLEFEENSFDGLVAFYSIFHVSRKKHSAIFQKFHEILKPDGIMLISLGSKEWEGTEEFHGAEMFWSFYSPEKSLQMIKDIGFEIISEKHISSGGETHYWVLAKNKK